MTKAQIIEAATRAAHKGEDLQLWQAVEWMHDYKLMTYKEYKWFIEAQVEVQKDVKQAELV